MDNKDINALNQYIEKIEQYTADKRIGLPEDLFLFISRTTPLVNIDLLVQDEKKGTLLAWRDDEYYGKGWHIPGGIVRFKETLFERIQRTAIKELGVEVNFIEKEIAINELFIESENRGHFISFLYQCKVPDDYVILDLPNRLEWHKVCPDNLIAVHDMYKKFF